MAENDFMYEPKQPNSYITTTNDTAIAYMFSKSVEILTGLYCFVHVQVHANHTRVACCTHNVFVLILAP